MKINTEGIPWGLMNNKLQKFLKSMVADGAKCFSYGMHGWVRCEPTWNKTTSYMIETEE